MTDTRKYCEHLAGISIAAAVALPTRLVDLSVRRPEFPAMDLRNISKEREKGVVVLRGRVRSVGAVADRVQVFPVDEGRVGAGADGADVRRLRVRQTRLAVRGRRGGGGGKDDGPSHRHGLVKGLQQPLNDESYVP